MNYTLPPCLPNFDAALKDIKNAGFDARVRAARSLGVCDPDKHNAAVVALEKALEDSNALLRIEAIESLSSLALAGAQVDEIKLLSLLDDPYVEVKCSLLENLPALCNNPLDTLKNTIKDEQHQVRASSVFALGILYKNNFPFDLNLLINGLYDKAYEVRTLCAMTLGALGGEKAEEIIHQAIKEDFKADLEAILLLSEFSTEKNIALILKLLNGVFLQTEQKAALAVAALWQELPLGTQILKKLLRSFFKNKRICALIIMNKKIHTKMLSLIEKNVLSAKEEEASLAASIVFELAKKGEHKALEVVKEISRVRIDSLSKEASDFLGK